MLVVTAALVKNGNKILITQRPEGGYLALKWEFPGGKVEEGEHPEDALQRELLEELGVKVQVNGIFEVVSHKYPDRHILLLCYECELLSAKIAPIECNDYKWVSVQDLNRFDFAGADMPIVKKLQKSVRG